MKTSNDYGTLTGASQNKDDNTGRHFPCETCGADMVFHIGVQNLKCDHCGAVKTIERGDASGIVEKDLRSFLDGQATQRPTTVSSDDRHEIHCNACGAGVVFSGPLTSTECAYCGNPIQRRDVHQAEERIPVDGLLAFAVTRESAKENLGRWVKSRWFAPNAFKKRGVQGKFSGIYLPFWTFDAMTHSHYSGERGEHYYTGSGKSRRRQTRWYPAEGSFSRFFDDVLVCAWQKADHGILVALEPWPLESVVPFAPEMMAGYLSMTYDISLGDGFKLGKERMDAALLAETHRRIGGDTQRVHSLRSQFDALTYKHIMLPVWLLAYKFKDKTYRLAVNACTGEVQGQRPYSIIKITLAVLSAAAIVASLVFANG